MAGEWAIVTDHLCFFTSAPRARAALRELAALLR
jgi:hypothetical protein